LNHDRIVGLVLDDIAVDSCITKTPGGGEVAGPPSVDRRKQGMKRSVLVDGYGLPLGQFLAGAHRHDSPLLAPTLDRLGNLGPLPDDITVHLDAGVRPGKTRDTLAGWGLGEIARKGKKAPIQTGQLSRRGHRAASRHRTRSVSQTPRNRRRVPPRVWTKTKARRPRQRLRMTARMNRREDNHSAPPPRSTTAPAHRAPDRRAPRPPGPPSASSPDAPWRPRPPTDQPPPRPPAPAATGP
jgi:hypothetical protein